VKLLAPRLASCIPLAVLCGAIACTTSQSAAESDSAPAAKENAGQITDSIIPSGAQGAVTASLSKPTTRANTSTTTRAPTQSKSKRASTGGEQDSAIQPKFSIDEKGIVRPIKH
jgi:hypothetical protein